MSKPVKWLTGLVEPHDFGIKNPFAAPDVPDYAAENRALEEERQAKIRAGTQVVNSAFDRFSPGYFKGIGEAYRGYYKPQVEDQAREANRNTTFRYAARPNSSASNRTFGNLALDRSRRLADVESGALGAETSAKSDVESRRGNLLNLVEAGSTLDNVGSQAITQANMDIGRPTFSPLGDLFSKYTSQLATNARGTDMGYASNPFWKPQIDALRGGGRGSMTVVRGG